MITAVQVIKAIHTGDLAEIEQLAKGDSPGHEFHGNQYSDNGAAAAQAAELERQIATPTHGTRSARGAALHAAKLAYNAASAHNKASRAASSPEAQAYHKERAASHKSREKEHRDNAAGRYTGAGRHNVY